PALCLIVAAATGRAWVAYLCVAAISALSAFAEPVVSAVLPNIVDREDLSLAQATLASVWGSMLFVGAFIGGLFTIAFGREASFVVNALSFLVSALFVLRVTRPFRTGPIGERASVLAHLREVWRFAGGRKVTRAFMVTKGGVGVGNGIVGLLPIYATMRFGTGDGGIAVLLGMRGLGALVGPYIGRALARNDGRRQVFVCGAAIVAYGTTYLLLPSVDVLWVAALCVALAHSGGGAQWVLSTHGLQVTTPDAIRGRVMSLDFGLATLAIGISALLSGLAAEQFGLSGTSYALAVLSLTYGLGWLLWTRDLWRGADDPIVAFDAGDAEALPVEVMGRAE
ncbi:MAG: MFS transporter, partial [Actinobacteria bacterium]|nr:MFS transporter [Actinomycetota bacterium]